MQVQVTMAFPKPFTDMVCVLNGVFSGFQRVLHEYMYMDIFSAFNKEDSNACIKHLAW